MLGQLPRIRLYNIYTTFLSVFASVPFRRDSGKRKHAFPFRETESVSSLLKFSGVGLWLMCGRKWWHVRACYWYIGHDLGSFCSTPWRRWHTGRTWKPIRVSLGDNVYVFSLSLASQTDTFRRDTGTLLSLFKGICQWSSMTVVVAFDQRSFISLGRMVKQRDNGTDALGGGYEISQKGGM